MKTLQNSSLLLAVVAAFGAPAFATVQIASMTPSHAAPQVLGTSVVWTVKATDTNAGPLAFQFNVSPPGRPAAMVIDFNLGTLSSGTWTSQPFTWVPTISEGTYKIQVVVKDFASGETTSNTVSYHVTPLVTGTAPVVVATANPLVALFSAPPCETGAIMHVHFQQNGRPRGTDTNWETCHPNSTLTFEIAGMHPSSGYTMFSETRKAGKVTKGPTLSFSTGPLPSSIPFPTYKVIVPPGGKTDTTDPILLHSITRLGGGVHYPDVATDLTGHIIWYYYTISSTHANLLTRPLQNGGFLSIEDGPNWNTGVIAAQLLRQLDLAGNIVRETNTGVIQQELLALGSTNGGPCSTISKPAPVGSSCLGSFHHEAIQSLPNGYTAVLADIEKIFPAGTQGDTSGLPVDIMGDMIIVLDRNWQVSWYFDTFEHDSGPPQLDINRPAVLGESCVGGQGGCPPVFLAGTGIAPKVKDWLHANSIYYWPQTKDLIWSSRHQDWVMKVDYQDGKGNGNILWRMGNEGDFTFNNNFSDPYPWYSHQHDVGIEDNGTGVMTLFDNGNTRVSNKGLGSNCGPHDCNSRGMALTFDETTMQVTPVLSQDLGYFSTAMGSAELLADGNFFFVPTIVVISVNNIDAFNIEIQPTAGTDTGTPVLNIRGTEVYRGWQMTSMYDVPTT